MASPILTSPIRKRTARACDHCKRRKTRCDGRATCNACTDTGLECSYGDQLRRAHGTKYVVHLEQRLKDLESQNWMALPNSSSEDKSATTVASMDIEPSLSNDSQLDFLPTSLSFDNKSVGTERCSLSTSSTEALIGAPSYGYESNILSDNSAVFTFRGRWTGIEIACKLRRLCSSFVGLTHDTDSSASRLAASLDASLPISEVCQGPFAKLCFVPQALVYRWVEIAFAEVLSHWPFIDRQDFNIQLDRLLGQSQIDRELLSSEVLGLAHAVIALGQRHDPELVVRRSNDNSNKERRGMQHFGAARALLGLAEQLPSVTAVQTILCMCFYLKSESALRLVHTYVSMAGCAAHHLGLHISTGDLWMSESERATRRRIYKTLQSLDIYVTSSLGLPRIYQVPSQPALPSYICDTNVRTAFDANVELLNILGSTLEKTYFADGQAMNQVFTVVQYDKIRGGGWKLEQWAHEHSVTHTVGQDLSTATKSQLALKYSECFVLLTLYSPFLHHIIGPTEDRSPQAKACGMKCVEAAILTVQTAKMLDSRSAPYEPFAFTTDVLAMAAITLLLVELGAPTYVALDAVKWAGMHAKNLLRSLAQKNSAAAQCLESLMESSLHTNHPHIAY